MDWLGRDKAMWLLNRFSHDVKEKCHTQKLDAIAPIDLYEAVSPTIPLEKLDSPLICGGHTSYRRQLGTRRAVKIA
jgi:hypothetical protein